MFFVYLRFVIDLFIIIVIISFFIFLFFYLSRPGKVGKGVMLVRKVQWGEGNSRSASAYITSRPPYACPPFCPSPPSSYPYITFLSPYPCI